MNSVVAVVVTYNRKALLKQCLESLLSQKDAICDVLVVDNASTDGTAEIVKEWQDARLHYRNTGKNLGGAGGFYHGIRWAVEAGYEFVWVMDDDTQPHETALYEFLQADALTKGQYGYLSSVALWTDGSDCKMNRQSVKKSWQEQVALLREGLLEIEQASFVSLFLKAKTIYEVGLPIPAFFIWGDDMEYTRRIAIRMHKPAYLVGKSIVTHAMRENQDANLMYDAPERMKRYWYAYRNENYTARKEGPRRFLFYLARSGRDFLRVLFCAKSQRFKRSSMILFGLLSGFGFHPQVEYLSEEKEK